MSRLEAGHLPWGKNPPVGGSKNSQIHGTSVIVLTHGNCPMKMMFKYPTLDRHVSQDTKWYISSPSFQMKLDDGWILVLDPIDDVLMLHSVVFDDNDDNEEHVRIAWVYHYLEVVHDSYMDTCTIRMDNAMMNMMEKKDE